MSMDEDSIMTNNRFHITAAGTVEAGEISDALTEECLERHLLGESRGKETHQHLKHSQ